MIDKMSDTKNVSVLEENEPQGVLPRVDEEEQAVVSAVFNKFRNAADMRNMNFENFDGQCLVDYIDDSVHRYTTNIDERENIEDWQARVHDQFTRNKVMAIVGKVAQVIPIAEFKGRGDEDMRRGQIITDLYEYSEDVDDYEELMVNILLESCVKGTAIGYEGYEKKETKIRDIQGFGDDITVTEKIQRTNRLYGDIVRLEDFYPSSVGVRKIKSMPFCFWRNVTPYQQFLQDFAYFARATDVPFTAASDASMENKPGYTDYVSSDVEDGQVEIIRYYNQDVDEYVVIANGKWLNPILTSSGKEISPLPFKHKELPFWEVRFESFDANFFYGKSLPDKLKSYQDVLNVLTNMMLDQSFLTVFKPILTNGFDSIEDDYLRPGRRTPIDTQGLSIKDAVVELDISTPSGWHQYILEYTRKIMEESSVDALQQGSASNLADRTPAQAVRVAAEGVASVLGLFGRFIKYGVSRKATLRAKNIMQFWTMPDSPIVEQILGEGGSDEMNKAFNTFRFESALMSNGKRGAKIIEMYAKKEDMPTKADLRARADIYRLENRKEIEIVAIPFEYIQNFDFDTKVVQNPKADATKESEQALQLEKVRVYKSFFPDMIDDAALCAQTAEKMGDDPTKIMKQDVINPQNKPDEGAQKSMVDKGVSTTPTTNIANNMTRGMQGGDQMGNEMQMISNEMA
jgi:hypothetical protein